MTTDSTMTFISSENFITTSQSNVTSNTNNNITETPRSPLVPCPRQVWELILWIVLSFLIILSNIICIKIKLKCKAYAHPENRYFVVNLAISNLFCGSALLITNSLNLMSILNAANLTLDICFVMCKVWSPIYTYCVMLPFTTLATLSFDIAFYCHHSIDYRRRMSNTKLYSALTSGWIYTFVVVGGTVMAKPQVLCDKAKWEISIFFIIFPIFLMFLPALVVVIIFIHIMSNYWKQSHHLAKKMNIGKIGAIKEKKIRLVKKFVQKFLHLIVFSIMCGILYTVLTVVEVVVENQNHIRLCTIYRLDRLCISLNSLISPWIYCFGSKQLRNQLKRKSSAWWHNTGSFSLFQQFKSTSLTSKRNIPCNTNSKKIASENTKFLNSNITSNLSPKLGDESAWVLDDETTTKKTASNPSQNCKNSTSSSMNERLEMEFVVPFRPHSLTPIKENE